MVIYANGDVHLGGDDFDNIIIDWLADEFKTDEGIDLRKKHSRCLIYILNGTELNNFKC